MYTLIQDIKTNTVMDMLEDKMVYPKSNSVEVCGISETSSEHPYWWDDRYYYFSQGKISIGYLKVSFERDFRYSANPKVKIENHTNLNWDKNAFLEKIREAEQNCHENHSDFKTMIHLNDEKIFHSLKSWFVK